MFTEGVPEDKVTAFGVVVDVGNTYVVSEVLGTVDVVGVPEDDGNMYVSQVLESVGVPEEEAAAFVAEDEEAAVFVTEDGAAAFVTERSSSPLT